ncbi:MAG TPA: hypothetical protein ENI56_02480 [Candidatus Kaiserbacteria bacterium]|nr:hypothetical protein [Candidatus Kaiserbacteria bacterium]
MQFIASALMGILLFPGAMFHRPIPQISSVKSLESFAVDEDIPLVHLPANTLTVTSTAYNAVPNQTDNSPFITASGAYSNPQVIVARSRDLSKKLPFGTIIAIEKPSHQRTCGYGAVEKQIGYRVVADAMNADKHNQIDILLNRKNMVRVGNMYKNPSIIFGVCNHVTIRIVGHILIRNIPRTQAQLATYVATHNAVKSSTSVASGDVAFR